MSELIAKRFGEKLRIRACGICADRDRMIMVNHTGLTPGDFWAPPGGGIDFGEEAEVALAREFEEETGLLVEVGEFLFACEFIRPPLHAIELLFRVIPIGGVLRTGRDPEMKAQEQIIREVRWMSWLEIQRTPPDHLHGMFKKAANPAKIFDLKGYFKL